MTPLLSGIILGLAGSLHCAGMCGPVLLVLAPGGRPAPRGAAIYHAARISMYVLIALPVGYAGRLAAGGSVGRVVAITAGALLIGSAAFGAQKWTRQVSRAWSSTVVRLGGLAVVFARRRPVVGYMVAGSVHGLLPCGLIYGAAGIAAAFGSVPGSALFMIGFGLGTLPALLGITIAASAAPAALRRTLRLAGPLVMVLAGLLLIWRGSAPASSTIHDHQNTRALDTRHLHP